MSRDYRSAPFAVLMLGMLVGGGAVAQSAAPDAHATTAAVLWQPSMNVFRRFEVAAEPMYEFYGGVLGFKQLSTLNVGNGGGVARFQAGAQELKLTRRVGNRSYEGGGVRAATGLRLLTFFFADDESSANGSCSMGCQRPSSRSSQVSAAEARSCRTPTARTSSSSSLPVRRPSSLAELRWD